MHLSDIQDHLLAKQSRKDWIGMLCKPDLFEQIIYGITGAKQDMMIQMKVFYLSWFEQRREDFTSWLMLFTQVNLSGIIQCKIQAN